MITVTQGNKAVKVERSFHSLQAFEDTKLLKVSYKEITSIDGVEVKEEIKSYVRDYDTWKASELGVAIIGLINTDLAKEDLA